MSERYICWEPGYKPTPEEQAQAESAIDEVVAELQAEKRKRAHSALPTSSGSQPASRSPKSQKEKP